MDFYAAFAYCMVRGVHEAECKVEVSVPFFLERLTVIYSMPPDIYSLEALTIMLLK